ncbi:unnamed protein product, partial [Amoebophrya sp. A25]|eukprot:GSA25T00000634001.1
MESGDEKVKAAVDVKVNDFTPTQSVDANGLGEGKALHAATTADAAVSNDDAENPQEDKEAVYIARGAGVAPLPPEIPSGDRPEKQKNKVKAEKIGKNKKNKKKKKAAAGAGSAEAAPSPEDAPETKKSGKP